MRSVSMKQKLFRGIVLLFLIYTAVELASPQFCGERATGILGTRSVVLAAEALPSDEASASARESVTNNSEGTLPTSPRRDNDVPDDDDCFCCCAHVMPSPLFLNPETSALAIPPDLQHRISIPTASLRAPYHPPRFA